MDYFGVSPGKLRQDALAKLASLAVSEPSAPTATTNDDFNRLVKASEIANVAMGPKEFDTLVGLCDATSSPIHQPQLVDQLVAKFKVYLLELPQQQFAANVCSRQDIASPWSYLGEKLTVALINLAEKCNRQYLNDVITVFRQFQDHVFEQKLQLSHYFTLLGYMQGLTVEAGFLAIDTSTLKLLTNLDAKIDTYEFLQEAETYSNHIYTDQAHHDYGVFLDRDICSDFSPILYLEYLAMVMCNVVRSCLFPSERGSYKTHGMLFELLESAAATATDKAAPQTLANVSSFHMDMIRALSEVAIRKLEFLDKGEEYIVYSTYNRLRLGYMAKSYSLQIVACGTFCDQVDVKVARKLFKNCLEIKDVMLDPDLGLTAFELGALLVFKDDSVGSSLTRSFTALAANPNFDTGYCLQASRAVGLASRVLHQDAVITTIYALTNLLFVEENGSTILRRKTTHLSRSDSNRLGRVSTNTSHLAGEGTFNTDEDDYEVVCENSITGIIEICQGCNDEVVSTLAVTILSQKTSYLQSVIGPLLLKGMVNVAPSLPEKEFIIMTRLLFRLSLDAWVDKQSTLLRNLNDAEVTLGHNLAKTKGDLYYLYLKELLLAIISQGEVNQLEHHRSHGEISEIGEHIALYLKPLANLLPNTAKGEKPLQWDQSRVEIVGLYRDAWFNMVVHGYSITTAVAKRHGPELERMASNSPPLASELSWDRTETSLELNTILRKGSSNHNLKDHKHIIGQIFEVPRTLSYAKLMFLSATVFVESLRVKSGDCSTILTYLSDPSMKISGVDIYIGPIAYRIVQDYIWLVRCGANSQFSGDAVAHQLTKLMTLTCFRVPETQDAAFACCDKLVSRLPSALAHRESLFTMFDLLTVMSDSLVDDDIHQYSLQPKHTTRTTGIPLLLSDQMSWRQSTFNRLHDKAKSYSRHALRKCAIDVKSLIQQYLQIMRAPSPDSLEFGSAFALELAGSVTGSDPELSHVSRFPVAKLNTLPRFINNLSWMNSTVESVFDDNISIDEIRQSVFTVREHYRATGEADVAKVKRVLADIAGTVLVSKDNTGELCRYLVEVPFAMFESEIVGYAISIWFALIQKKSSLPPLLIAEIGKHWNISIVNCQGLFSKEFDIPNPEFAKMEYAPSNYTQVSRHAAYVDTMLEPHLKIIRMFASSFEATLNQSDHLLKVYTQFVSDGLGALKHASYHPYARGVRFELVRFGYDVLSYHIKLGTRSMVRLTETVLDASLSWFRHRAQMPFGPNQLKTKSDFSLLKEIAVLVSHTECWKRERLESKRTILRLFLDDEINTISVWLSPSDPVETVGQFDGNTQISSAVVTKSYALDPILAVNLALRYKVRNLDDLLQAIITKNPLPATPYPDAVQFFIGIHGGANKCSHHLLWWSALSPIDAITMFLPPFGDDPYILQYSMRSLESHDVNLTFFYVPQIVQSLRHDHLGYVERFILETAQVSQLFAHQIIWNMLANSYRDEDSTDPDPLKPTLDRIQSEMLKVFSKKDFDYYELEFNFFAEVTDISGKLKPYIKKSKAEKKHKIDEEMARIVVKPGVYLPSNPDGVVVDINRKSGKPLQSHAKAPFMATFKIKKDVTELDSNGKPHTYPIEKWQSAIFKVGDDCRQDVLALQLISIFRSIWEAAGVDLYVFPYRVTATAPGCGVIDVLPNSTSRDMMGREAVNGLYEYYISKFGPETSIEFQQARTNLVKSLAAYSIISFLLQFKDRHNGNIMYDDQGHVLHIDFGFCFDIVPGGVKFEAAPFKLTHEMMLVLGGSSDTQAFRWFEELCIKGYLACRPYMELIVRTVQPMLESGLPCFKEHTIRNLRKRFVPNKSEKEASLYFKGLIKKSMESFYTKGYDEFQRITNGIPY